MSTRLKGIAVFICAALSLCALFGCTQGNAADEQRDPTPVILSSAPLGDGGYITQGDSLSLDYGNASLGFVNLACYDEAAKIRLQISFDGEVLTYIAPADGEYHAFPLTRGSGYYTVNVYANISSDRYALCLSADFYADIANENSVYLYPNAYVEFGSDEKFLKLSEKLAKGSGSDLDAVEKIYSYVVKNIDYDYKKAENPPIEYLPDISLTLSEGKGICFDYASLMCALLRSQRIPSKLVVGYSQSFYHAWISVWIEDVGWVEDMIYFDGTNWSLMDPTYDSTSNETKSAKKNHYSDTAGYNPMYYY